MRTGIVKKNLLYGTIAPNDHGSEVYFNPAAVRPAGYWPAIGEAVEFETYVGHSDWAKLVRVRA